MPRWEFDSEREKLAYMRGVLAAHEAFKAEAERCRVFQSKSAFIERTGQAIVNA